MNVPDAFHHVKQAGDGWTAQCPAHDDARNSLSIGRGDGGRVLLKCHAGCSLDVILAAAHLTKSDLFPTSPTRRTIEATYRYVDEQGTLLYEVVRYDPKDFRARAANGAWSIKGVRRVLYRLPHLAGHHTVFVVEGEKDADRLWSVECPTTTGIGGAGKWRSEYVEQLQAAGAREIVVLPDNDPPGLAHGREIARSCVEAGLAAKLIVLPDLPPKGDVSNYLTQHTRDELLAVVHAAPLFTPAQLVSTPPALTLMSFADLLDEPDERVEWVVEHRIPARGVTLVAAPPKVGKSTLARQLTVDVATGQPFLGWSTTQGAVWYLAFQDAKAQIKKHLRGLGATATDPIRLFIGQPGDDLWPQLHALADREHPTLIIVDMLAHVLRVKDFNDYAGVTTAFEPLLHLTRATGAALVLLHHGSAHQFRDGLDAVLGSTALSGCVDNVIVLKRDGSTRSISTVQRIGDDIEPMLLTFDKTTGRSSRGATKQAHDDALMQRQMLALFDKTTEPVSEAKLQTGIDGRNTDKVRVLRILMSERLVERTGAGKRGDPYLYSLARARSDDSRSHESDSRSHESENSPVNGHRRERESDECLPTLLDPQILIPVPDLYKTGTRIRECDRLKVEVSTTSSVRTSSFHVPILVPEGLKSCDCDPSERPEHPDKHWSDSRSHGSRSDESDEEEL